MHPDVAELLAVQADDVSIHETEAGIAELMPRVAALAAECSAAGEALAQARQRLEAERKRRRDIEARIVDHRQLHEKNQSVLNTITSQREATAAMAQLEQVTNIIAEEEREISAIGQRIYELESLVADRESALEGLEERRMEAEASVAEDRTKLQAELDALRVQRESRARKVPRALLSRYDRLRSKRRVRALFPLRGNSCSHCDTAIPMQRRTEMVGSGATEVCEGCGVLLYATD